MARMSAFTVSALTESQKKLFLKNLRFIQGVVGLSLASEAAIYAVNVMARKLRKKIKKDRRGQGSGQ